MIDYKKVGRAHLYLYKGAYRSALMLSGMSNCVVPKGVLKQRLCQMISNSDRTNWSSIEQCMTTKIIAGYTYSKRRTKITYEFIDLMMLMPTNDNKPLIMQSK